MLIGKGEREVRGREGLDKRGKSCADEQELQYGRLLQVGDGPLRRAPEEEPRERGDRRHGKRQHQREMTEFDRHAEAPRGARATPPLCEARGRGTAEGGGGGGHTRRW